MGGRELFVFGERICGAESTFLDAARVARVGRVVAGTGAAFALFLGTVSSALLFSLSSDISSLVRFTPRVDFGAAFVTVVATGAAAAGAGRVRRLFKVVAGAGAFTGPFVDAFAAAVAAAFGFIAGAVFCGGPG